MMDMDQAREELRQADRREDLETVQRIADDFPALGREWALRRKRGGGTLYGPKGIPILAEGRRSWWSLLPALHRVEMLGVSILPCWSFRVEILFLCDCVQRVLPFYEAVYDSPWPRRAVEAARAFVLGQTTEVWLRDTVYRAEQVAFNFLGGLETPAYFAAWAAASLGGVVAYGGRCPAANLGQVSMAAKAGLSTGAYVGHLYVVQTWLEQYLLLGEEYHKELREGKGLKPGFHEIAVEKSLTP